MNDSFMEGLKRLGWVCQYDPGITEPVIRENLKGYAGIVINTRIRMDRTLIDNGQDLKFIARAGSGMENIELEYAASKGIICLNSPEGNRDAVAEHALALLLGLLNRIYPAISEVKTHH